MSSAKATPINQRQFLPRNKSLDENDPSIIYLPNPGKTLSEKPKAVVEVGGASVTETTSLLFETTLNPHRKTPLLYAVASGGETTEEPFLLRGTEKLIPPDDVKGILAKECILLPSDEIDADDPGDVDLDREIDSFFDRYLDVPEFTRKLMRTYSKMSWVFQQFAALPYLRFIGPPDSGKTTMAATLMSISYRGMEVSGSMTAAVVYRLMDRYKGTMFIDEADFSKSSLYDDIVKVLNAGYRRGAKVYRCDSSTLEPEPYDPFGPKILTTRKRFLDEALESRCITLPVYRKALASHIPLQLPATFHDEARELRNRLLGWRFRRYFSLDLDASKVREQLESRVAQIAIPLYVVARNDPTFQQQLIDFLGKKAEERRIESFEAVVVEAMRVLYRKAPNKPSRPDEPRILRVKQVAEVATKLVQFAEATESIYDRPQFGEESQKVSARRAGHLLRNLGFEPEHKRFGAEFELSKKRLDELMDDYPIPQNRVIPPKTLEDMLERLGEQKPKKEKVE